jgi:hypothetical protein
MEIQVCSGVTLSAVVLLCLQWCYSVCSGFTLSAVVLLCLQWCYSVCSGVTLSAVVLLCLQWCYSVCSGVTLSTVVLLSLLWNSIILLQSPWPGSRSLLGLEDPQAGGGALLRLLPTDRHNITESLNVNFNILFNSLFI